MVKIITANKPEFEPRDLIVFPKKEGNFTASLKAFGPGTYLDNLKKMRKDYSHPKTGKRISFRPATSREGIIYSAYEFKDRAKKEIFNQRWFQLDYILRGEEGVWANLPKDEKGNPICDEKILKNFLNNKKPINGIYLLNNETHFAFVPYGFKEEEQSGEEFARSSLARGLEYTSEKIAEYLEKIASKENYSNGVYVHNFKPNSNLNLNVASFDSYRSNGRLNVDSGDDWNSGNGYAVGILEDK